MRANLGLAARLAALGLLAAGPALSAPLGAQDRADAITFGRCAYYTSIFMETVKLDGGTEADRALIERSNATLKALGQMFDATRPPIDQAEYDQLRQEVYDTVNPRLDPLKGRPDQTVAIRDEFRADLEACVAKADALIEAAKTAPTSGTPKP